MPEQPDPKIRSPLPPISAPPVGSSPPYAELDVTTNFSFLRGSSHPDELVRRAAELGYAAIGITDVNSLAGVVRAHQAAKEAGIKLCVGTRLRFTDSPDVLAWAQNRDGYANLCRLLTTGKRRSEKGCCTLAMNDLLSASGGLAAALAPQNIDPQNHRHNPALIESTARALKEAFAERLSLAVSRVFGPMDQMIIRHVQSISRDGGIPLLATNQVHYHEERRRMLQNVLTCIRHGCTIQQAGFRLFSNSERFLKSPRDMHHLFSDLPAALRRGGDVARQCAFTLDELRYEYPDEIVPPGQTPATYLAELTWAGAAARYPAGLPDKVRRQIEHELRLIGELKIEPYFLTVYDLVRFARSRGILCQGRGSAANSAVCYCIGVTSVDPACVDLLFERFVSRARNEPPDIDIDFEHERREEVIQYVYQKYGRERSAMTAEVITYRGRSAVRDVGKAMGLGLDAVDQMAKRLDWWDRGTLTPQKIREVGLDPDDRVVRLVIDLSGELLGFPRHLSQHVGGLVMSRRPLCESVPIENASMPDRTVIEWDKDDIDAVGMLKVDVLALGMLTALAKGMKLVSDAQPEKPPLELHTIPAEDPDVYDMICDADTVGVFQIESRAQMSMLPRLKPRQFYDLVIEVAIVRPGPIQGKMVHPYLRRREGIEPVSFPKPELEAVLGKTLGVPLFQEQAMKVAMVAAGFSAEEADRLRRSMAAWRYNGTIAQFHRKIVDGMIGNGYQPSFAEQCFEQIKGFGEYGFPESHAASFALLVYASAWLKRRHPAVFCVAILNSQPMGFYAPAQLVRDAREHGVEIRPVDVNHSDWDCTLEQTAAAFPPPAKSSKQNWGRGGPAVRLGFRMIRGLHAAHAQRIVECRRERERFESIDRFHEVTALPISAVTRLAEADAFSSLARSRRPALWDALALPDEIAPLKSAAEKENLPVPLPAMTDGQEISADYASIGLSLKGHPLALVRHQLEMLGIIPAAKLAGTPSGERVKVAGLVLVRQRPGTASGIVFVTLEDETGIANLIIRPDVYERYRPAARHARLLQAEGRVEKQGKVIHVLAARLTDLSGMSIESDVRSRDFH